MLLLVVFNRIANRYGHDFRSATPSQGFWDLAREVQTLMPISQQSAKLICLAGSIAFCLCASVQSSAQAGRCPQAKLDKLEADSGRIRDWATLRTFFHCYTTCRVDDAEITEGISESVVRMLADHWETLPIASNLFKQDPKFETFALAGINITDSTDDLNRIDKLATDNCPANLHTLCLKIRKSIRDNN